VPETRGQDNELMQYSFLKVFADNRTIDADELRFLERLALRDHRVDDRERATLRAIFERVTTATVTPEVWLEMQTFRQRHAF
jgi:hypothetical protein